jgi:hypothetical protein
VLTAIANFTRTTARRAVRTGQEIWLRVGSGYVPPFKAIAGTDGMGFRWSQYELRDMLLDGSVYRTTADGGARKWVLKWLGRPCDENKYPITAHYNPFRQIVRFYDNALGGRFGQELKLAERLPVLDRPTAPVLADPLARLWRWSNLDTLKSEAVETVANQGTAGLRVVLNEAGDRVSIELDDPRTIRQVDTDSRGNVVNAYLAYDLVRYGPDGKEAERLEVEEWIGKDGFSQKVGGEEKLSPEQQRNPLGLCPYVLMRQDPKGRHAYHGSEMAIHAFNWLASQVPETLWVHLWPTWFATSPADEPRKFNIQRHTLIYAKTEEGKPVPTLDPMVPTVPVAEALEAMEVFAGYLREQQPQLIFYALKLLSNISGETLQQVRLPAESESLRARALYESSLVSALQIGLSLGVYNGLWDLGTGTRSPEAVERAYGDGAGPEAFAFAERPALPETTAQKLLQAQADTAAQSEKYKMAALGQKVGTSEKQQLRDAGFKPSEINKMMAEIAEQVPDEADAQGFGNAAA